MSSRAGTGAGLLVLVLLASTTLLPLAAADHAYSHRYVIYGRLVDSAGHAVPGLEVRVGYEDVEPEGGCANQPNTATDAFGPTTNRPVTNQYGEFTFCTHIHSLSRAIPGRASFVVPSANNFTHSVELDPYYRVSYVTLQLPDEHPAANRTSLETTYTVAGRLWREGNARTHVESIRVFGETVDDTPVNITLRVDGQPEQTLNATTNGYGDFAVRFPVQAKPTSGTIVIEADGERHEHRIDSTVGIASMKIELEDHSSFLSSTTLYAILGILAAAAIVAAAFVAFRRAAARREEDAVRNRSERRRANK